MAAKAPGLALSVQLPSFLEKVSDPFMTCVSGIGVAHEVTASIH